MTLSVIEKLSGFSNQSLGNLIDIACCLTQNLFIIKEEMRRMYLSSSCQKVIRYGSSVLDKLDFLHQKSLKVPYTQ